MSSVYLELRTECPRCLLRVPINGISQTTKCARCGEFLQLAPEAVLSAIVRGREGQIGLFGTGGGIEGRFGPESTLRCSRCQGSLDTTHIVEEGVAPCESCGVATRARPVPEPWAQRVPAGITHLVGEHFEPMADDPPGAPLVRRFYLWADPDVEKRLHAERTRRVRRVGAWLMGVGLPLCAAGVALWLVRGALGWSSLGSGGFGAYLVLFGPLGAATVGAGLFSAGLRRFVPALEIVLGILGFAIVAATSIYLYVKGFSPWPVAGLAVGSGWFWYVLRNVIPSV